MARKRLALISIAVLATLFVTLVYLNLVPSEKHITSPLTRQYTTEDPQFKRTINTLLGPPLLAGNKVEALLNGDQIFPPMLEAIKGARHSITFETYIYWEGQIGQQFADALIERARAGVAVHVILDWLGSVKANEDLLKRMAEAGVEVERFHEPSWWTLDDLNNRTHRKLLVVDGRIGFTGGVGIADHWLGDAQDSGHWRDTHFRIEGPVVAQVQAAFVDNWIKSTGSVLHGNKYFPDLKPAGDHAAQMFISSPSGGSESMQLMYLAAISSATQSILLSAAYFVPDALMTGALVDAANRGVRVSIIVPGKHIDAEIVRHASRESWGPLLTAGVKISTYSATMYHCKVLIVDDLLVSVGSTNFDARSLKLNDEANLNVLNREFALAQRKIFEQDLTRSRPVTLEQWLQRPWHDKVMEKLSSLFAGQL